MPSTSGVPPVRPGPNDLPSRRPKIKARRKLVSHSYICVLDTNVILDDLNALKSLTVENATSFTCDKNLSKSNLIYKIIVPMVVLQELDGIKMSKNRPKTLRIIAQNAIKFINEQLMLKEGLFQGAPDKNPENRMSECTLPVESNDDRILECATRLTESFSDKTVILLTSDLNLQSKAATWKIEAMSIDAFKMKHKESAKASTNGKLKFTKNEEGIEPLEEPKQKRLKSNSASSTTTVLSEPELETSKTCKVVKSDALPLKPQASSAVQKAQLETALIKFIVDQLEKQYGKTWITIFNKFNPKVATLTDSLKMLKLHWLGVFSDCFQRDSSVLEMIKSLLNIKNAKNLGLVNQLYSKLFNKINKVM